MTDRTLFDGDNEPAILIGHGPIPAPSPDTSSAPPTPTLKAWIRRLYTDPDTGHLINGDAKRRDFSHAARQFLLARDHTCRTPWCDAPIRHTDHITAHSQGGPTTISNGQGACEACNYTKEAPGWSATTEPDGITITLTTPTGHTDQQPTTGTTTIPTLGNRENRHPTSRHPTHRNRPANNDIESWWAADHGPRATNTRQMPPQPLRPSQLIAESPRATGPPGAAHRLISGFQP